MNYGFTCPDNIPVLHLNCGRLNAQAAQALHKAVRETRDAGRAAMLIDMSGVSRLTHCGLAALVECYGQNGGAITLGFFGITPKVLARINKFGLGQQLPIYATLTDALEANVFRRHLLAGSRAVILAADAPRDLAPLSWDHATTMLDLLGQPVLSHLTGGLRQFGLRDVCIAAGHNAQDISHHLDADPDSRVILSKQGKEGTDGWEAAPLGTASTLAHLQREISYCQNDLIVLHGDTVGDIDLPAMMEHHRRSGALATVTAFPTEQSDHAHHGWVRSSPTGLVLGLGSPDTVIATSKALALGGIYILSPSAIRMVADRPAQDLERDLLPSLLANRAAIQIFESERRHRIRTGRDYAAVLQAVLRGEIAGLTPDAQEVEPGKWIAKGAEVSRTAKLRAPCFVGRNSIIGAHATLSGGTIIGADSYVGAGAQIDGSIIMPKSHVVEGSELTGQLASPFWAVETAIADGRSEGCEPLDAVRPLSSPQPATTVWRHLVRGVS